MCLIIIDIAIAVLFRAGLLVLGGKFVQYVYHHDLSEIFGEVCKTIMKQRLSNSIPKPA